MKKKKKKGPSCWKGYRAAGKKKSPSGKKTVNIKDAYEEEGFDFEW